MSIPVIGVVATVKYFGRIESIDDETGDYGRQAAVKMKPCNPEAVSYKTFWMKLPEDPIEKPSMSSKWMKFVTSFNKVSKKAIALATDMVGAWVCIEETPKSFERTDGTTQDYMEPLVSTVYANEDAAMLAWKTHQSTIVKKVATPEPVPFDEPKPTVVPVPDAIAVVLKSMLAGEKGDKEKLWEKAQSMGFTKMQVLSAVD